MLTTIAISVLLGFALAEAGLRLWQRHIITSEKMSEGFILYDEQLGWRLAENWNGTHRHFDYTANYSTNTDGFRLSGQTQKQQTPVAVIGDSFTFGLGVNDNETFVERLNANDTGRFFQNYAVPGYSNDQQWLLLQQLDKHTSINDVLWFVYLGNDLLDNVLPFPLQAEYSKPWLELRQQELRVNNIPVPQLRKPAQRLAQDSQKLIAPDTGNTSVFYKLLQVSKIGQLLVNAIAPVDYSQHQFGDSFNNEIAVFNALLTALSQRFEDGQLTLVLLPGRSFVELPDSYAAALQAHFRLAILSSTERIRLRTIDLATLLQEQASDSKASFFYPNDGHLNPLGHQISAKLLQQAIDSH